MGNWPSLRTIKDGVLKMTAEQAAKAHTPDEAKPTKRDKEIEARKRLARQVDPDAPPVWVPDRWLTIRRAPEDGIKVQARSIKTLAQANVHVSHPGLTMLLEELAVEDLGVATDDSFCWAEFRFMNM